MRLNRAEGPDAVLQIVEDRAPDGYEDLEKVLPLSEREALAARYKQTAGFDRETLNNKPSMGVPGTRAPAS